MNPTNTFRGAYAKLQSHAETLRNQREPDLDNLLTIVNESLDAFKVCQSRIDAVEKALEEALSNSGLGSPVAGDQRDEDSAPVAASNSRPMSVQSANPAAGAQGTSARIPGRLQSFTK